MDVAIFVAVLNARDVLEKEYIFIDVISTFLRAIRAGAIHIQHGAVVLAHYGRLEVAFDACSRIIVDILREETVMKEKPDLIVSVVTKAMQEVCDVDTDQPFFTKERSGIYTSTGWRRPE